VNIGKVDGNGFSDRIVEYDFIHKSPANGFNYYRLQQVDRDGRFDYSDVVMVNRSNKIENTFSITPNRVENIALVQYKGENAQLSIINMSGQIMLDKAVGNNETLDMNNFSSGLYLVKMSIDGILHTDKIFKK